MASRTGRLSWGQLSGLAALCAWYVAYSFSVFDHNDFMYASTAHMTGPLYDQVHYVQAPLGYYVLRLFRAVSPAGDTLLGLRLSSSLFVLLSVYCILAFALASSAARWLFLACCAASPHLLGINGEIGSYSVPLFLIVVALLMLQKEDPSRTRIFAVGALIGLATSIKISHLLFGLPVLAFIVYSTRGRKRPRQTLLDAAAFCVGFSVGAAFILHELWQSWAAFHLHNVQFHELTNKYRGLTLRDSAKSIARGYVDFALWYLPLIAALLFLNRKPGTLATYAGFLFALFLFSFIPAALPRIMFSQYLAPSALLLFFGLARSFDALRARTAWVALAVLSVFIAYNFHLVAKGALHRLGPGGSFTLVQAIEANRRIALLLEGLAPGAGACERAVFTFSGALVVDSGLALTRYTEGGIFWRRLRGVIPEAFAGNGSSGFERFLVEPESFLRQRKVAFLLTGWYPEFEGELVAYAEENGFRSVPLDTKGRKLTFWHSPSCLPRAPATPASP